MNKILLFVKSIERFVCTWILSLPIAYEVVSLISAI